MRENSDAIKLPKSYPPPPSLRGGQGLRKKILHLREELQHMTIVWTFFYLSLKYNLYFPNILWFL
jgi:hypothetical protein